MASQERLRHVLKLELPDTEFDSANLNYFCIALENENVTDDEVIEAFSPFLVSYSVASDDDACRDVSLKILARLRAERFWSSVAAPPTAQPARRTRQTAEEPEVTGEAEAVAGMDAWLKDLRLTNYREQAFAWCKQMGAVDVEEVIENNEEFSQALGLKPLERKRVLKAKMEKNAAKVSTQNTAAAADKAGSKGASTAGEAKTAVAAGYPASKDADTVRRNDATVFPEVPKSIIKISSKDGSQYHLMKKIGEGVSATVYRAIRYEEAPIFGVDVNGLVNEWNRTVGKLLGYNKEDAIGKNLVADFVQPESRCSVQEVLNKALDGVETENYELTFRSKEGKCYTVLLNATTQRDASRSITGVVGLGQVEPREYAVKAVSLSRLKLHGDFGRIAQTLKREIDVLFTLRHKNIVSLYDVIEQKDTTLYLILEFVSGGDLFEYIVKNGCLAENEARFVFLQLVDALKHIHSKGIVHRDLKPENLLIHRASDHAGLDVKISDFGHSKLVDDGYSVAVSKVGTPQYWAPEVSEVRLDAASKRMGYDHKADLWSLGVVLYVMLEGTYPFDGVETRMEEQIRKAEVKFKEPHRPSKEARDVITGLIRVSPKDRISLDQLRHTPWIRGDGHGSAVSRVMDVLHQPQNARQQGWEETIDLPSSLSEDRHNRRNVWSFRTDLQQFTTNFKHGAVLSNRKQVSVTWRTDDQAARNELFAILRYYFPEAHFPDRRPVGHQDERGSPLAPVREDGAFDTPKANSTHETHNTRPTPKSQRGRGTGNSFRMIGPFKLRVDEHLGAGLELREENNGMYVKLVDGQPGQPNLKAGDIITKISSVTGEMVALGPGTPEQVRETFGSHFRDGAEITVKRKTNNN